MENWDDHVSLTKRNNISWWEKRADTDFDFFFLVITCLSAESRLRPLLECTPTKKIVARRLSPPHIFMARVQLSVFTLSRFTIDCLKATNRLLTAACPVGGRNSRFRRFYPCAQEFSDLQFSLVIFNYKSFGLVIRRLYGYLFIYLSIYFQFQFSISRSITLQH